MVVTSLSPGASEGPPGGGSCVCCGVCVAVWEVGWALSPWLVRQGSPAQLAGPAAPQLARPAVTPAPVQRVVFLGCFLLPVHILGLGVAAVWVPCLWLLGWWWLRASSVFGVWRVFGGW